MKKLTTILAMCMVVIPMMAVNTIAPAVVKPYEWVEYGEYNLNGKDTAVLILTVIYEDISLEYKGYYAEFDMEWQRVKILTEISTAIEIIDTEPINWQIETQKYIVKIQKQMDNWILNLDGKDYTNWLDYAVYFLDNPEEIFNSEITPFNCQNFQCWAWMFQC
jgi:hypothetical protein